MFLQALPLDEWPLVHSWFTVVSTAALGGAAQSSHAPSITPHSGSARPLADGAQRYAGILEAGVEDLRARRNLDQAAAQGERAGGSRACAGARHVLDDVRVRDEQGSTRLAKHRRRHLGTLLRVTAAAYALGLGLGLGLGLVFGFGFGFGFGLGLGLGLGG